MTELNRLANDMPAWTTDAMATAEYTTTSKTGLTLDELAEYVERAHQAGVPGDTVVTGAVRGLHARLVRVSATGAPAGRAPGVMIDDELRAADETMTAERTVTGAPSLTVEHRAIKAELGRRAAARALAESRQRAGRKAADTRKRRAAAGLPPKSRTPGLDNPPAGGWTDADRVVQKASPAHTGEL